MSFSLGSFFLRGRLIKWIVIVVKHTQVVQHTAGHNKPTYFFIVRECVDICQIEFYLYPFLLLLKPKMCNKTSNKTKTLSSSDDEDALLSSMPLDDELSDELGDCKQNSNTSATQTFFNSFFIHRFYSKYQLNQRERQSQAPSCQRGADVNIAVDTRVSSLNIRKNVLVLCSNGREKKPALG